MCKLWELGDTGGTAWARVVAAGADRGMPESSEGQGIECGAGMRVKVEGALCDQLVC